jgi:hypothetical protein
MHVDMDETIRVALCDFTDTNVADVLKDVPDALNTRLCTVMLIVSGLARKEADSLCDYAGPRLIHSLNGFSLMDIINFTFAVCVQTRNLLEMISVQLRVEITQSGFSR